MKNKSSALHLACNNGHEKIVEFICEMITRDFPGMKNMLINAENKYFFTPLISACFRGYMTKGTKKDAEQDRIRIVKCLLENGANAKYVT